MLSFLERVRGYSRRKLTRQMQRVRVQDPLLGSPPRLAQTALRAHSRALMCWPLARTDTLPPLLPRLSQQQCLRTERSPHRATAQQIADRRTHQIARAPQQRQRPDRVKERQPLLKSGISFEQFEAQLTSDATHRADGISLPGVERPLTGVPASARRNASYMRATYRRDITLSTYIMACRQPLTLRPSRHLRVA